MAEIVKGLFGVDPTELVQQRNVNNQMMAKDLYGQDPLYGAAYRQIYSGAGGMLGAAAPMLGIKDAEMEQAQSREQLRQQMDLSTPQGAYAAATLAKDRGDMELATNLVQYARQAEVEQKKNALVEAQTQGAMDDVFVGGSERGEGWKQNYNKITKQPVGLPYKEKGTNVNVGIGGMKDSDWLKYANKHTEDRNSTLSSIDQTADATRNINQITTDKDFSKIFGGYPEEAFAKLGSGEIAGITSRIEDLRSKLRMAGLTQTRQGGGIGAITEKEWPILEGMIANIHYRMDEKTAKTKLAEIQSYFDRAKERAKQSYSGKWKTKTEFYQPLVEDAQPKTSGSSLPAGFTPL